ncbi:MAG TPA: Fic family protein [Streptosporangiaceae bacterium]|nr:Fic family protein [Streptosporangiaceae bacterium]
MWRPGSAPPGRAGRRRSARRPAGPAAHSAVSRTGRAGDACGTIWEKAAALLQSLACNHGWVDGNKRTAWVAVFTFLTVNGHPLDPGFDQDAAEEFMVAIAEGRYTDVAVIAGDLVKFSL